MKMMNNFLKLMVMVFCLTMPVATYSQSSSKLFQKGESLMQSGKYNDAIKAFNAAMQMDSDLETSCKAKISQCQEKISQRAKAAASSKSSSNSYKVTIDKETAEFGCETRTAVQIKVNSLKAWDVKTDESWCKITKLNDNLASIECETNESVYPRTTLVLFANEYEEAKVEVRQEGQQPYIKLGSESVEFPRQGGLAEVKVSSNTEWEVYQIPEWCTIVSTGDEVMVLKVAEFKEGRQGSLIVRTTEGGELASLIITQTKKKK